MKKTLFIAMFYFLFGATFSAVADQGHKPYVGSKAFERMKQLVSLYSNGTENHEDEGQL